MNKNFDSNAAFSLEDKVIIVTGGGTGIGKVYSQRLAAGGAKVVLADIANKEADEVARGICETGGTALSVPTDVSMLRVMPRLLVLTPRNAGESLRSAKSLWDIMERI